LYLVGTQLPLESIERTHMVAGEVNEDRGQGISTKRGGRIKGTTGRFQVLRIEAMAKGLEKREIKKGRSANTRAVDSKKERK